MSCTVCGGTPASYRYGAIVCGACKAFFVRWCVDAAKRERCYLGGHCQITSTRRPCKPCRYEKCVKVGMFMPNQEPRNPELQLDENRFLTRPAPYNQRGPVSSANRLNHLQPQIRIPSPLSSFREVSMLADRSKLGSVRDGSFSQSITQGICNEAVNFPRRLTVITKTPSPAFESPFLPRPKHLSDISFIKSSELSVIEAVVSSSSLRNFLKSQYCGYAETAEAVRRATDSVFGDQLKRFSAFMERAIEHGEIPYQPQTSLEGITREVQNSVKCFVNRIFDFALCLPGFSELNQASLFQSKWGAFWMIFYSVFWKNNEFFCLLGDNEYHYGRYWLDIMNASDPKRVSFISSFAETLNSVGLDQTETFLLLAITLLKTDNSSDSSHLSLLYKRYLDSMLHIVSWRRSPQSGQSVIRKLDHIFSRIRMSEKLHVNQIYYFDVPVTTSPSESLPSHSIADCRSITSTLADSMSDHSDLPYDPFSPMRWPPDLV